MKANITVKLSASILIDIIAVLFIIFLGDIAQFFAYPVYELDPMRMMVMLAIAFTPRWNGFLLALLLPFVSFYMGAHPHLVKTSLMAMELIVNVGLFWFLFNKTNMSLLAMLLSIMFSKGVYYLLKYVCLQLDYLSGDLISTPLDLQVITTISFSLFVFIVFLIYGKPKRK